MRGKEVEVLHKLWRICWGNDKIKWSFLDQIFANIRPYTIFENGEAAYVVFVFLLRCNFYEVIQLSRNKLIFNVCKEMRNREFLSVLGLIILSLLSLPYLQRLLQNSINNWIANRHFNLSVKVSNFIEHFKTSQIRPHFFLEAVQFIFVLINNFLEKGTLRYKRGTTLLQNLSYLSLNLAQFNPLWRFLVLFHSVFDLRKFPYYLFNLIKWHVFIAQ